MSLSIRPKRPDLCTISTRNSMSTVSTQLSRSSTDSSSQRANYSNSTPPTSIPDSDSYTSALPQKSNEEHFFLPSVQLCRAKDQGKRAWLQSQLSFCIDRPALKNAVLKAQMHAVATMDLEQPLTPKEIAAKASEQVRSSGDASCNWLARRYLEKKAVKYKDNITVSPDAAGFALGSISHMDMSLDGPILRMQDGKVFQLPVTLKKSEKEDLYQAGTKLTNGERASLYQGSRFLESNSNVRIVRNLSYDPENRRRNVGERFAAMKLTAMPDSEGLRSSQVREISQKKFSAINEHKVFKKLPVLPSFSKSRSHGIITPTERAGVLVPRKIYVQVLDLGMGDVHAVLEEIEFNKIPENEKMEVCNALAIALGEAVVPMHNHQVNGKPAPMGHGSIELSNFVMHADETFKLSDFGGSQVDEEYSPVKPMLAKDTIMLGKTYYQLLHDRKGPEGVDLAEWNGHEDSDTVLAYLKANPGLENVARLLTQKNESNRISVSDAVEMLKDSSRSATPAWDRVNDLLRSVRATAGRKAA